MIRPLVSLGLSLALFGLAGSSHGQTPPTPGPTPTTAIVLAICLSLFDCSCSMGGAAHPAGPRQASWSA